MADQRTPADLQDYHEALTRQLKAAFASQIKHSQESAVIIELLQLIARLLVALDDSPTDVMVIQDCYEIGQGVQPQAIAQATRLADMPTPNPRKTMGELEAESLDGFINDEAKP